MDNTLELGWDSTSCDLEPLRSRVLALVKREQEAARASLALVTGTVQQQLAQHQADLENQQRDCSNCIMALFDSHRSVGASGTVSDGMDGSVREMCASMSSSVPTSSTSVTDRERVSKNYNARLSRPVTVSFSGVESLEHRVSRLSVVQSVTHAVGNWSTKINKRRCHCDRLKVVLTSQPFVLFIFSLIFVNSGMIAVTADLSIRDALADWSMRIEGRSGSSVTHGWLSLADSAFNFVFLVEICLRLLAFEGQFFFGQDRLWNMIDLLAVVLSMVENVISQISSSSPNIIRMVRLLRIGRSCRTVRLLRFAPFLYKFRFLVSACVNSLSVLFWALLVLTVLTYIFSVTFLTSLASWIEGVGASETSQVELVSTYFSTLPQTMLTLFMSITGGVNWSACVDVFADVSWVMVVLFLLFIVLSLLAVMNVITSVFVSDAIEVAQQDRDIRMRAVVTESRRQMAILKEIFQEMDTTNSGSVSSEQFELGMRRHDVMSLFHLVELDVLDATSFFQLLDEDQDGAVDLEGFVMGCLRMKGNANRIDIGISVQETKRMVRDSMDAQKDSERRLEEIEHLLRSALRPVASL